MNKNIEDKGQVVILLLLIMVIALAIGLSTVNRSVLEVSTSRKSEDSSRAFSAAEAGMEKAIQANLNNLGGTPVPIASFSLDNQASANIDISPQGLPLANTALSYPPFGKESFAQFWLVNPNNVTTASYTAPTYDIYFGDPNTDKYAPRTGGDPQEKPAIEVNTIYWDGSKYSSFPKYFDSYAGIVDTDVRSSNFSACGTLGSLTIPLTITVNNGEDETFYCRVTISGYPTSGGSFPVMVRVRILYSNISHPVAIRPASGASIPKQANIYLSSGTSGSVKRTLEVFHQKSVMPQFFDYVLFSAAHLQKL